MKALGQETSGRRVRMRQDEKDKVRLALKRDSGSCSYDEGHTVQVPWITRPVSTGVEYQQIVVAIATSCAHHNSPML